MGLKDDLEKACIKNLGDDAVTAGNCPKVAVAQTDAIVNWITKQTFIRSCLKLFHQRIIH